MPYLEGLALGLAYVAPIGAQNLFVINSALTKGRGKAFITALFVVFFDVTLAWACFFGVGAVLERFPFLELILLLLGGLVILRTGVSLIRTKTEEIRREADESPLWRVFLKACVVTWFNPQAVIDGTMLFGAFRATLPGSDGLLFILGVTTASFCWFNGMTLLLSITGKHMNAKVLRGINLVCGAVLSFYGLRLLYNLIQMAFNI